MQTASWLTYRGPGRIGISRGMPRRAEAGFRMYRALAPHREMLGMAFDDYRPIYVGGILARLDPQETWDRLHALAYPHEPVLLCFERPPFTRDNFCHRHLVAEWFGERLGHEVPEAGVGIVAYGAP